MREAQSSAGSGSSRRAIRASSGCRGCRAWRSSSAPLFRPQAGKVKHGMAFAPRLIASSPLLALGQNPLRHDRCRLWVWTLRGPGMTRPPHSSAWQPIEEHPLARLEELFEAEPDRLARMTLDVAGIYFDWSKTHLDAALVDRFVDLAEANGLAAARDALFAGEI